MPNDLLRRAKREAIKRKTTLRGLMVDALDQSLNQKPGTFRLKDASVGAGYPAVDNETINQAIDEQRGRSFNP